MRHILRRVPDAACTLMLHMHIAHRGGISILKEAPQLRDSTTDALSLCPCYLAIYISAVICCWIIYHLSPITSLITRYSLLGIGYWREPGLQWHRLLHINSGFYWHASPVMYRLMISDSLPCTLHPFENDELIGCL
ncbi:hypothetical protein FIBSPDRAFT_873451 [Athelia psychrophila]|uniref:Uncharacterized protein n=1 Tax=Athelia psychrophila TaxID=1759441 RepID=A0A165YIT5_9AGAM|nr:hypothetical protein FIBSPDRAFT_873451 [Fibularhizoctonia sp. CBS 109695]